MEKLGLGFDGLLEINPRLIYLSMSMQGATGPESTYSGYGITIAATSGLTHLSGDPDRYPVGTGTHFPDHVPNPSHAAFAVLAAVRHQRRTGRGQMIEIAQTEPTVACIGAAVLEWTALGSEPAAHANRHPEFVPHGVYPARDEDRWIALAARTDDEWIALARVLGIDAASFGLHVDERRAQVRAVDRVVGQATADHDAVDLVQRLQEAGVPAAIVATSEDLIDHDPQLRHRGHWVRLDHPEMGPSLYGAAPFRLSATPGALHSPAPLLGQHTGEVLRHDLHLTDMQIADLADGGVLT